METLTQFGEHQDGVDAGMALKALFRDLGTNIDEFEKPSPEELEAVFQFIWDQSNTKTPLKSLMGFLETILRRDNYSTEIINIFGTKNFIESQKKSTIWTLPPKSGIIAFGTWTGDIGDGDSWCLDIDAERIICITFTFPETADEARRGSYAALPELAYLEAYLRKSAELRDFLHH